MKDYEPVFTEVREMENQQQKNQEGKSPETEYAPRPTWQVWAARVGLVIFLLIVAAQCLQIAGGIW